MPTASSTQDFPTGVLRYFRDGKAAKTFLRLEISDVKTFLGLEIVWWAVLGTEDFGKDFCFGKDILTSWGLTKKRTLAFSVLCQTIVSVSFTSLDYKQMTSRINNKEDVLL